MRNVVSCDHRPVVIGLLALVLIGGCRTAKNMNDGVGASSDDGTDNVDGAGDVAAVRVFDAGTINADSGAATNGGPDGSDGAVDESSSAGGDAVGLLDGGKGADSTGPNGLDAGAPPYVYVSGGGSVGVLKLDTIKGDLSAVGMGSGGGGYVAWDSKRKYLYALAGNKVVAFAIAPKDGTLTKINEASTAPGTGAAHLSVHPSGKWVFVAHYGSGHVAVLPVQDNGGVGAPKSSPVAGKNAHSVLSDPSGQFVFVPCLGSDYVAQFNFNVSTGALTPNKPASVSTPAGSGPRHIAFHPTKDFVYVINEVTASMTGFAFDKAAGTLTAIETLSTTPAGVKDRGGGHVAVHPSGAFVYGSNRFTSTIAVFSIDQATGRMTLVGHENAGGTVNWPEDFAIDPSGRYLVVGNANATPSNVMVFAIDSRTGKLTMRSKRAVSNWAGVVRVMPPPEAL